MKYLVALLLFSGPLQAIAQDSSSIQVLPDTMGVTERMYGKVIHDPFRWMEKESPQTKSWMVRKNQEAITALQQLEGYDSLLQEIKMLRNSVPSLSTIPVENQGKIYSLRVLTENGVEEIVLFDHPADEGQVIFSTEGLNQQDSTFYTIFSFEPSPDNRYLAIQLYPDGNDQMEIRVFDVEKRRLLDDVINASISYFPSWLPNSKAFFYTQLSLPEDQCDLFDKVRVKIHTLGEPQTEDRVMLDPNNNSAITYEAGDFPVFKVLPDSNHIQCSVIRGISQYASYYVATIPKVIQSPTSSSWRVLFDLEDQVSETTAQSTKLYGLSHREHPEGSINQVKLEAPEKSAPLYSVDEGYINTFKATREALYVEHVLDGLSHLIRITDQQVREVELPFLGNLDLSTDGFFTSGTEKGLFFGLSNWAHGYGIYYHDPVKDTVIKTNIRPAGKYDLPTDLVVEEVNVPSHDGVPVPLSIIYDKRIARDGSNPTVVEAYGAYGESLEPYFSVEMLAWYRRGGILAYAHVRGGGEKGMSWHDGGRKETKSNSWKDLIACSEYLIDQQYTSPSHLGIRGGSAGGIAVGRAMTERPELFGAVALEYPMVNPTRLNQTPDPIVQQDEFGSPEDSVEFQYLYQMDTYLYVEPGTNYPALLLTAGKNDTRVPTWEPAKLAARMASDRGNDRQTLFRLYEGGHGVGDAEEALAHYTDPLAFFLWQLKAINQR